MHAASAHAQLKPAAVFGKTDVPLKMEKEICKDADRRNLDSRVKHRNQRIYVHVYVWTNAGALVHEPNRQMGGNQQRTGWKIT